ncbi:MAG: hypothetical protein KC729_18700, partial [Candidatus Eisenbacteria bacterium]|nr:hypothetical protein [Candidatus Eisenbacteria bacterium]
MTAAVPDSLGAHSIFRFLWIYGRRGPDATGMSPDSLSSRFGSAPPPSSSGVPGTKGSSTSGAASEEGRVGADEVDADGTGAFGASAPADSLDGSGAPVPVDSLLQRDRKPGLGALDPLFEIDPAMVEESTERRPREMLPWLSTLRVQPSGAYHTPDPIGWGDLPGRERVAVLLDGSSVAPPAFAETAPDPLDPVWTNSITVRRASPLRLPNEPAGGPLLEYELIRPESLVVLSGVRLTDGSAVANTDAIYLARPTPKTVTHVMWADHKAGGRIEYGSEDGQDLLLRHERSTRWGRWALGVQNHDARQRVFQAEDVFRPSARWLWDRSAYTALVEGRVHGWSFRGDGEVSWHRYAWEGTDHAAKRKDGVERALLRLQGPGARWSPRLSAQVERHRWR